MEARFGIVAEAGVVRAEVAQRKAVQMPTVGGVAKRAEICVVRGSNEHAAARCKKAVNFFLQPAQQQWIMQNTDRRPVIPQVKPDSRFPTQILVELQFPSTLKVVNALLDAYLNEIRPPSHAIFVLDTSGSMSGSRLEALKKALTGLTGLDDSLTGQFAQFRAIGHAAAVTVYGRSVGDADLAREGEGSLRRIGEGF